MKSLALTLATAPLWQWQAYASDPGKPTLVDPTGVAASPGGCTPVILINVEGIPQSPEHVSNSGREVHVTSPICVMGDKAVAQMAGKELQQVAEQVVQTGELSPELEARLDGALQTVEAIGSLPAASEPVDGIVIPGAFAAGLGVAMVVAGLFVLFKARKS